MAERIRVVETVVYEYEPDFSENHYAAHHITTAQAALEIDQADYEAGKIFIGELCYNIPERSATWEIVNE